MQTQKVRLVDKAGRWMESHTCTRAVFIFYHYFVYSIQPLGFTPSKAFTCVGKFHPIFVRSHISTSEISRDRDEMFSMLISKRMKMQIFLQEGQITSYRARSWDDFVHLTPSLIVDQDNDILVFKTRFWSSSPSSSSQSENSLRSSFTIFIMLSLFSEREPETKPTL